MDARRLLRCEPGPGDSQLCSTAPWPGAAQPVSEPQGPWAPAEEGAVTDLPGMSLKTRSRQDQARASMSKKENSLEGDGVSGWILRTGWK